MGDTGELGLVATGQVTGVAGCMLGLMSLNARFILLVGVNAI
jgi:hypothetical protein